MKRETYQAMLDEIEDSCAIWIRDLVDRILTRISYIIYPLFLLYLMVTKKPELGKAILVRLFLYCIKCVPVSLQCAETL